MKKKILAVDVDQVLLDIVEPWIDWYETITGDVAKLTRTTKVQDFMPEIKDPLIFFKNPNLYDELKPYPEAISALKNLSKYYDIVFVSHCFPEHEISKRYFLKRYFDFEYRFISTGDKEAVKMDIFIDDSIDMLNKVKEYQPNVYCIQYVTNISIIVNNFIKFNNWKKLEKHLEDKK